MTAALAAAQINNAKLSGAEVGSLNLDFTPGLVQAGLYLRRNGQHELPHAAAPSLGAL